VTTIILFKDGRIEEFVDAVPCFITEGEPVVYCHNMADMIVTPDFLIEDIKNIEVLL